MIHLAQGISSAVAGEGPAVSKKKNCEEMNRSLLGSDILESITALRSA